MMKYIPVFVLAAGLAIGVGNAQADDLKIDDYEFRWYAANVGDVHLDIEKNQAGLKVILRSPGGSLARISLPPEKALAIGNALKKETVTYYDKQMKNQDYNAENMVPVGEYKIYYRSSRGRKFEVSVRAPGVISAAVIMTKDEALRMADHLLQADKMAALVNERVLP